MNEYISKINLDDLYERENTIIKNREKIYNKILLRIHKKIKHTSRTNIYDKFCFFLIPEFIMGVPRYDVATCIAYVIEKLQDNGFHIKYTHPNLLFISWNHFINRKKRDLIKKIYGITIDGFGNKKDKNKNTNEIIGKKSKLQIKKEDYKDINQYKPTGKLVYNLNLFKDIEDISKK